MKLINYWMQTNDETPRGFFRYNVSCSQHYKTSRGRNGMSLTSPPAPNESAARRRGPTRRSSSNTSLNKLSSRTLPVKVKSVLLACCNDLCFCSFICLIIRYLWQVIALLFFLKETILTIIIMTIIAKSKDTLLHINIYLLKYFKLLSLKKPPLKKEGLVCAIEVPFITVSPTF